LVESPNKDKIVESVVASHLARKYEVATGEVSGEEMQSLLRVRIEKIKTS